MMHCGFYSTVIVSAVVLSQLFSVSYGHVDDLEEIFRTYHTAVVTVIKNGNTSTTGTGFSVGSKEETPTRRCVITAFHVVKGAYTVQLKIYHDEQNSDETWKYETCPAEIYGFDIVRDVAFLDIACDICNCSRLGYLEARHSTVNKEEMILVIGDSVKERPHSFRDGKLSSTNFTFSPASQIYKDLRRDVADTKFVSRVHELTGSVNFGDPGSAVLDGYGDVIGMLLPISEDGKDFHCVTMEEIFKGVKQMFDTIRPHFVACTAHESAFLGRTYWGDQSGKSIREMNALTTAMDAQYFAVAHDGLAAHAFTFHALWWDVLPAGDDKSIEDATQCLCEKNSFTDSQFLKLTKHGHVMCGCSENACRKYLPYQKRFGEDNDRRWAVYKRLNKNPVNNKYYVPSKESRHMMENIADQIDYWKEKTVTLSEEKRNTALEIKFWMQEVEILTTEKGKLVSRIAIVVAVATIVASSLVICLYNCWRKSEHRCINIEHRCKNSERLLREANTELDRLKEQLSQQDELLNPTNAPTQESNKREEMLC